MDKESVQATSPKAYDQVLEYLKTLIKNKDISYGGKIPSERELMETLRISRNSVREALRILEHTGVLESRHGKGNFLVNRMGESLSSVFSMLVLMEESRSQSASVSSGKTGVCAGLRADFRKGKSRSDYQPDGKRRS